MPALFIVTEMRNFAAQLRVHYLLFPYLLCCNKFTKRAEKPNFKRLAARIA